MLAVPCLPDLSVQLWVQEIKEVQKPPAAARHRALLELQHLKQHSHEGPRPMDCWVALERRHLEPPSPLPLRVIALLTCKILRKNVKRV